MARRGIGHPRGALFWFCIEHPNKSYPQTSFSLAGPQKCFFLQHHRDPTSTSSRVMTSNFLRCQTRNGIYTYFCHLGVELLSHEVCLFILLKSFPRWLYQYALPSDMKKSSHCSTPSLALGTANFFIFAMLCRAPHCVQWLMMPAHFRSKLYLTFISVSLF